MSFGLPDGRMGDWLGQGFADPLAEIRGAGVRGRISTACAYRVRGQAGRDPCGQPVVLVITPNDPSNPVKYCFPPSWQVANVMSDNDLVMAYGRY